MASSADAGARQLWRGWETGGAVGSSVKGQSHGRAVLGPWVNSRGLNLFTGAVIAVLILLSMILTVAVLFPGISEGMVRIILVTGSILAVGVTIPVKFLSPAIEPTSPQNSLSPATLQRERQMWRMPPLDQLPPAWLTVLERMWLSLLRVYLVVAAGLVLVRTFREPRHAVATGQFLEA